MTQAEFTTYAQAIVREVDQQWQQARALAQSQREAWQNLRRMRSNARRCAVNPGFAY